MIMMPGRTGVPDSLLPQENGLSFVLARVCSHCIDRGSDGACHTHDPEGCAILRFYPELEKMVREFSCAGMMDCYAAVRNRICSRCANGYSGRCNVRDSLECALDCYLPLVIDAFEEHFAEAESLRTDDEIRGLYLDLGEGD